MEREGVGSTLSFLLIRNFFFVISLESANVFEMDFYLFWGVVWPQIQFREDWIYPHGCYSEGLERLQGSTRFSNLNSYCFAKVGP